MPELDTPPVLTTPDRVERPARAPWRNANLSFLVSGAAITLIEVVTASWTPTSGEPLFLRWLRVVADHPIRSGMGFCALTASILHVTLQAKSDDDPWRGL